MKLPDFPNRIADGPVREVFDCTKGCSERTREQGGFPIGGGPSQREVVCQRGLCSDGKWDPTVPPGYAPAAEANGIRNCNSPTAKACRLVTEDYLNQERRNFEDQRRGGVVLATVGGAGLGAVAGAPAAGVGALPGALIGGVAGAVTGYAADQVSIGVQRKLEDSTTIVPKGTPFALDAPPTGPRQPRAARRVAAPRQRGAEDVAAPPSVRLPRGFSRGFPLRLRRPLGRLLGKLNKEAAVWSALRTTVRRWQAVGPDEPFARSDRQLLAIDGYLAQVVQLRKQQGRLAKRLAPALRRIEPKLTRAQAKRLLNRLRRGSISARARRAIRPFGITPAEFRRYLLTFTPAQLARSRLSRQLVRRAAPAGLRQITALRTLLDART
jgi:hypothetical protein